MTTFQPYDGVGYTYLIADETTATDPVQQTTYTLSDGNVIAQNLFGVAGDQTFTPYPAGPNLTP